MAAGGRRSRKEPFINLNMSGAETPPLAELGTMRDDGMTEQDAAWLGDDTLDTKEIANINREARRLAAEKKRQERLATRKTSKQN